MRIIATSEVDRRSALRTVLHVLDDDGATINRYGCVCCDGMIRCGDDPTCNGPFEPVDTTEVVLEYQRDPDQMSKGGVSIGDLEQMFREAERWDRSSYCPGHPYFSLPGDRGLVNPMGLRVTPWESALLDVYSVLGSDGELATVIHSPDIRYLYECVRCPDGMIRCGDPPECDEGPFDVERVARITIELRLGGKNPADVWGLLNDFQRVEDSAQGA